MRITRLVGLRTITRLLELLESSMPPFRMARMMECSDKDLSNWDDEIFVEAIARGQKDTNSVSDEGPLLDWPTGVVSYSYEFVPSPDYGDTRNIKGTYLFIANFLSASPAQSLSCHNTASDLQPAQYSY